jgi:hypothetical protein
LRKENEMPINSDETYVVGPGRIFLTVLIGNAQIGSSLVKLGEKEIGRGNINNLPIGNGSELVEQVLSIKSIVSDVSDKTNLITVRYTLKGGKIDKDYDLREEVAEEGDSTTFRTSIVFSN